MTAKRSHKGGKAKPVKPAPVARRTIRSDVLGWLLARRTISPTQHAAGVIIRGLWAARLGPVNTNRFAEKIDARQGGKGEAIRLNAITANRRLHNLIAAADIGVEAVEIVIRVCGEGESLAAIALSKETDPKRRATGRAGADTEAEVRRLLRNGLAGLANVAHGKPAHGGRVRSYAVLAWLAEGARPKITEEDQ